MTTVKSGRHVDEQRNTEDNILFPFPWIAKLCPTVTMTVTLLIAGMTWLDYVCIDCMDDLA